MVGLADVQFWSVSFLSLRESQVCEWRLLSGIQTAKFPQQAQYLLRDAWVCLPQVEEMLGEVKVADVVLPQGT